MLCDKCQERNATVHLSQSIDGDYSEINLCAICLFEAFFSGEIFSSLKPVNQNSEIHEIEGVEVLCDFCGVAYSEYQRNKSIGCGNCELSFREYLEPLKPEEHGEGKSYKETKRDLESGIREFRKKLEVALKEENYEYAAILRDKIMKLDNPEGKSYKE